MSDIKHTARAVRTTSRSGDRAVPDIVSMIIAGIAWGTGGLFGSLLATHAQISAVAVAACRLLGGGVSVVTVSVLRRTSRMKPYGSWRVIGAVGALAALFQTAYFAAVILINVSVATLITIAAAPVLVSLVEIRAGWRRVTPRLVVILVLTVVGLALLVGSPLEGIAPSTLAMGTAAALVSSASFAAMTLIVAHARTPIEPSRLTGLGFTAGGLLLVPVVIITGGVGSFMISPEGIAAAVGLALIPTAVGYGLYFRALTTIPATVASVMAILEPLTAAVLGHVVLGERLSVSAAAGGVLLLVAIVGAVRDGSPAAAMRGPGG